MNFDRCCPMEENALISNLKSVWPETFKNNELLMICNFMLTLCMRNTCAVPARNAVSALYALKTRAFFEVAHLEVFFSHNINVEGLLFSRP